MMLSAALDPAEVPAGEHEKSMSTLTVTSTDASAREVNLRLTGQAADWAWIVPATLTIPAGGAASARIIFSPPQGAKLPAGPLPFSVTVTGGTDPVVVQGTVGIREFHDLFASLTPTPHDGNDQTRQRLKVENRGNTVVRADLVASASFDVGGPAERELRVSVDPPALVIGPGARAEAVVCVESLPRGRRGTNPQHRFEVVVRPANAPAKTVIGRLPQPASRSGVKRAPVLAGLLALLVAGGLGLRATVLADDVNGSGVAAAGNAACPAEGHVRSGRDRAGEQPTASGYIFLSAGGEEGCFPARFNPCAPVSYVLNDALAPPGGVQEVREAIARVAEATGISIVEAGTSDEPLAISRSPYQPERYGQQWAPILIGWSALGAAADPDAAADVIVVGRGRPLRVDNVLVSGVLELNVDAVRDRTSGAPLPSGFGQGITTGRVILHELGHVFGLGHPSGRDQLMYDELAQHTLPQAEFGIGDRAGLRLLGTPAGCLDVPPLPAGAVVPR